MLDLEYQERPVRLAAAARALGGQRDGEGAQRQVNVLDLGAARLLTIAEVPFAFRAIGKGRALAGLEAASRPLPLVALRRPDGIGDGGLEASESGAGRVL